MLYSKTYIEKNIHPDQLRQIKKNTLVAMMTQVAKDMPPHFVERCLNIQFFAEDQDTPLEDRVQMVSEINPQGTAAMITEFFRQLEEE